MNVQSDLSDLRRYKHDLEQRLKEGQGQEEGQEDENEEEKRRREQEEIEKYVRLQSEKVKKRYIQCSGMFRPVFTLASIFPIYL